MSKTIFINGLYYIEAMFFKGKPTFECLVELMVWLQRIEMMGAFDCDRQLLSGSQYGAMGGRYLASRFSGTADEAISVGGQVWNEGYMHLVEEIVGLRKMGSKHAIRNGEEKRSTYSNVFHALCQVRRFSVMAYETSKVYKTHCRTYGYWFERFILGFGKGIGDMVV
jgi:hypothetical protein